MVILNVLTCTGFCSTYFCIALRSLRLISEVQIVLQVKRAQHHNEKAGLKDLCTVVQGNFLHMPFEKESFDAAYSCEATCHAPKLTEVYKEIFK
jgi:hypothetical protein